MELQFDLPMPHRLDIVVSANDIDAYNHVNNAVYVRWCDRAAWNHSATLGLPLDICLKMDRGMAVLRTTIAYLKPALLDEALTIATWLLPSESRIRIRRRFQVVRLSDAATLVRAEIEYACIELSSGRPSRWPSEFREVYIPLPEVVAKLHEAPLV